MDRGPDTGPHLALRRRSAGDLNRLPQLRHIFYRCLNPQLQLFAAPRVYDTDRSWCLGARVRGCVRAWLFLLAQSPVHPIGLFAMLALWLRIFLVRKGESPE